MADMLSQEEINALLGGVMADEAEPSKKVTYTEEERDVLSSEQKDILGEIGNISMGTAATTLSALLNQRVNITTPVVKLMSWSEISNQYERPCVGVRIDYTIGLKGTNLLILVNKDVKVITNLMMGGDGIVEDSDDLELTELDLSAIGEAMNQMIGSSSTSLASMVNEKIDIATPKAFHLDFKDENHFHDMIDYDINDLVVAIFFDLQIGELIDSKIVQAFTIDFASQLADKLTAEFAYEPDPAPAPKAAEPPVTPAAPPPVTPAEPQYSAQPAYAPMPEAVAQPYGYPPQAYPPQYAPQYPPQYAPQYAPPPKQPQPEPHFQNVNAQPVQFQNFDFESAQQQRENIDILMDVPLDVTVELGKTSKRIKDILEFSPGTIIELDKLAGEPIDILVNGKYVAKGEVVVIEENFAIRITSIVSNDLGL